MVFKRKERKEFFTNKRFFELEKIFINEEQESELQPTTPSIFLVFLPKNSGRFPCKDFVKANQSLSKSSVFLFHFGDAIHTKGSL